MTTQGEDSQNRPRRRIRRQPLTPGLRRLAPRPVRSDFLLLRCPVCDTWLWGLSTLRRQREGPPPSQRGEGSCSGWCLQHSASCVDPEEELVHSLVFTGKQAQSRKAGALAGRTPARSPTLALPHSWACRWAPSPTTALLLDVPLATSSCGTKRTFHKFSI